MAMLMMAYLLLRCMAKRTYQILHQNPYWPTLNASFNELAYEISQ